MDRNNILDEIFGEDDDDDEINKDPFSDSKFEKYNEDFGASSIKREVRPLRRNLPESFNTGIYSGDVVGRDEIEQDDDDDDIEYSEMELNRVKKLLEMEEKNYMEFNEKVEEEEEEALDNKVFEELFQELKKKKESSVDHLQRRRRDEIIKAKAVLKQKILADSIIKIRIKLQNTLTQLNQLEINKSNLEMNLKSNFSDSIRVSLNNLATIGKYHYQIREETDQDDLEKQWGEFNKDFEESLPEIFDSLDLWERTTTISNLSPEKVTFKSINQSMEKRVNEEYKKNLSKNIERSQTLKSEKDIRKSKEIYTDNNFFQNLVKEFLKDVGNTRIFDEKFSVEKEIINEAKRIERLKQTNKSKLPRRNISKDRKLNFDVKPKLIGYLTPTPFDYPQNAQVLFDNLFGGKFNKLNM